MEKPRILRPVPSPPAPTLRATAVCSGDRTIEVQGNTRDELWAAAWALDEGAVLGDVRVVWTAESGSSAA